MGCIWLRNRFVSRIEPPVSVHSVFDNYHFQYFKGDWGWIDDCGAESSDSVNGPSGNIMFQHTWYQQKGWISRAELWSGWLIIGNCRMLPLYQSVRYWLKRRSKCVKTKAPITYDRKEPRTSVVQRKWRNCVLLYTHPFGIALKYSMTLFCLSLYIPPLLYSHIRTYCTWILASANIQ